MREIGTIVRSLGLNPTDQQLRNILEEIEEVVWVPCPVQSGRTLRVRPPYVLRASCQPFCSCQLPFKSRRSLFNRRRLRCNGIILPPSREGEGGPRVMRKGGPKIALRGGGGFQKWASVPGSLFCVRTDVATKGAGTQILARKIFFPPTYV